MELPRVCTWHWEPIFFEDAVYLGYVEISEVDLFGNQTRQRSTYRRVTGGISPPVLNLDVWFRTLSSY